jgi:hypothetical protein
MRQRASPNPIPCTFCCDKEIKYTIQELWIDPWSCVLNRNDNCLAIMRFSRHFQYSTPISNSIHCFDGVADQINEHLLQLTLVGP